MTTRKATIGTISHGTTRHEELIPSFSHDLRRISDAPEHIKLCDQADAPVNEATGDEQDDIDLLYALIEALNECAPPYCYFGAHPGDGSDYGFWPDEDVLERPEDFDILKVNGLEDVPDDYRGEVILVNDHGNVTMGWIDEKGEFQESWSCV